MIYELLKITFISILSFNPGYALQENANRKNEHRRARPQGVNEEQYTFALIPKSSSPFFSAAREGCLDKAKELGNVECLYIGTEMEDPEAQNSIVREIIKNGTVQAIAISVTNAEIVAESIDEAIDAGIPVVTFDSDAPQSRRVSYIGTDNLAFGQQLAKVLMLLDPEGGKHGKYGFVSGAGPNLAERVQGFNSEIKSMDSFKSEWTEIDGSPTYAQDNTDIALDQCYDYADNPGVRAIVPVGGWPMWDGEPWKEFVNSYRDKKLSLVVADALDDQIDLLNQGYCDALVGQLPYEMGTISMETLYSIMQGQVTNKEITGTNLLQVLRVPINLPPININNNYIGNLRYAGIALYAIIGLTSITFIVISIIFRKEKVIRSSGFPFILMICIGTLICGSFLITTAIDDEYYSQKSCDIACKMTPWVLVIGFTVYFSGLFGKIITVFLHMQQSNNERIIVGFKGTYLPLIIALALNVLILLCYTFISPLYYDRGPLPGTDPWNRVLATSGRCTSPNQYSLVFSWLLFAIASVYIIVCCGLAYYHRAVTTEYSESFYIMLAVGATVEALVIGAPVMMLTKSSPRTLYLVQMSVVFLVNMMVLLLISIPKIAAIKSKSEPYPNTRNGGKTNNRFASPAAAKPVTQASDALNITADKNVKLRFLSSSFSQN